MFLVLAAACTFFTGFAARCRDIRQDTLRLHILANSDSDFDQGVKLAVRDAILEDAAELFSGVSCRAAMERQAQEKLPEIEAAARAALKKLGVETPVKAQVVTMFFDTRVYGEALLPAGRYRAVRVTLGKGQGKNWWCVLFPPLCLPAAGAKPPSEESEKVQKELLPEGERPRYRMRLAVVEWAEELRERWADS
ncbi:MAG: stage II sporulation protein R [Oscillospiraceae bacterium]|nr:stage II sporulation protein R [Oscillospiraceae bacterium]